MIRNDAPPTPFATNFWRPSPPLACACVTIGIVLGSFACDRGISAPVFIGGVVGTVGVALTTMFIASSRAPAVRVAGVAICLMCAAAMWTRARFVSVPLDELHDHDASSRLVCVEGHVVERPIEPTSPPVDGVARFMHLRPSTRVRVRVDAVLDGWDDVTPAPWRGTIEIIVGGATRLDLEPGDRVRAIGRWSPFRAPRNPGARDARRIARRRGLVARVIVQAPLHLKRIGDEHDTHPMRPTRIERFRERARAVIPRDADASTQAMLGALLLGTREPAFASVYATFRRIGLAHILAISGMHLVIVVGGIVLIVRLLHPDPRLAWIATALTLGTYLILVPARTPVTRAGIMVGVWLASQVIGVRLRGLDICALAAIAVLIADPAEIFMPGFQLSFGVVFALILLTRPVDRLFVRWSERGMSPTARSRSWIRRWFETSIAASLVAWLSSAPLVAFHFGMMTPLGAPLSVLAAPLVTMILVLGYARGVAALTLPRIVTHAIDLPLTALTDASMTMATWFDRLPFVQINVTTPGLSWFALLAGVTGLMCVRRARVFAGFSACVIAAWPMIPGEYRPSNWVRDAAVLRLTMFDVGDGSAYVLQPRASSHAIMIDAGSRSDPGLGARVLIPGLRALGVRRLDALIVTHADLDHYCGAIEVIRDLRPRALIVTPQMVEQWTAHERGPLAFLRETADRYRVPIRVMAKGNSLDVDGTIRLTWLHPGRSVSLGSDNNHSAVISIDVTPPAGPRRRVLFTGDIEANAIRMLLADHDPRRLHADIMELPHHGSWSGTAVRFVRTVSPSIILQSTGESRMMRDRWARVVNTMDGTRRYVTARDGATTITIDASGRIRSASTVVATADAQSTAK